MLVLSRREGEKVLFPTLGISVEVLRVRGSKTRLGIDAPPDVPVIRHEIAGRDSLELTSDGQATRAQLRDLAHVVRKRLDGAATALNQLHIELDASADTRGHEIISQLYHDLESLEQEANQAIEWTSAAKAMHVLVVEDSAIERKLLGAVLELSGLNVATAEDGQDALDFLSMHAMPDAVLLDMLMPRCDGPDFVRQVRLDSRYQELKIFAVSSIEPGTLGLATGPGGINGWFPKPLEPAELISALDRRLRQPVAI